MFTIKKLFITLTAVVFITLGFSHTAYATELINLENDNIEEADVIEKSKDEGIADTEEDIADTEEVIADTEEGIADAEDLYDLEFYDIFEDEQGQVYYLEKEPVELEIEEIDELIQEDELEEEAIKLEEKKPSYSEKDLRLLSCLIYTEAGNQNYKGMLAVANVVLNRVKSNVYNHVNTIEKVIYDNEWAVQFSVTKTDKKTGKSILDKALEAYDTGKFSGKNPAAEKKAMKRAIKAAKAALNGENNIGDYLCFRMNNKYAKSTKEKFSDYRILGDHIFYRTK